MSLFKLAGAKGAGLVSAIFLLGTGHAAAQVPVSLSDAQDAALAEGDRVRVIVMMSEPSVPLDAAAISADARQERSTRIRERQDSAVTAAFGLSLDAMETRRDRAITAFAEDRPDGQVIAPPPAGSGLPLHACARHVAQPLRD